MQHLTIMNGRSFYESGVDSVEPQDTLWEGSTPYISASSTDQQKIIVVHVDSSHNGNHWS